MKQRPRIYYTETDKALMWDRWQKGDSLHAIARLFDRSHSAIARILRIDFLIKPFNKINESKYLISIHWFWGISIKYFNKLGIGFY